MGSGPKQMFVFIFPVRALCSINSRVFPALLTTLLFAISGVAGSRMTRVLGGIEANYFRILLATALLGLWAHTMGQGFTGPALYFFLLSGLIGFGFGDLALYQAFPLLGSRLVMLLVHCL